MKLLPKWALTNLSPAFYDCESGSAIQQTAKVYGAMNELIEEYNNFVDEINKNITDFENGVISSNDEFKTCITNLIENYIKTIDLKIQMQDQDIEEAVSFFKTNLSESLEQIIAEMRESGELSEDILNALGGLNSSLTTLTNKVNEIETSFDSRITTIENSMPYYIYDEETEELVLQNIPTRSE